jgi:hypothetical protein
VYWQHYIESAASLVVVVLAVARAVWWVSGTALDVP